MEISVRPARKGDGAAILTVHFRAIHEIACADYPLEILDAWHAPMSETELVLKGENFDRKVENGEKEIVLVAEIGGSIAGFGEMVPAKCELLAIYVNPDFQRRGVGRMILGELERIARQRSFPHLQMDASLTAVAFYLANGYIILERSFHTLWNGTKMACVKMKKDMT